MGFICIYMQLHAILSPSLLPIGHFLELCASEHLLLLIFLFAPDMSKEVLRGYVKKRE